MAEEFVLLSTWGGGERHERSYLGIKHRAQHDYPTDFLALALLHPLRLSTSLLVHSGKCGMIAGMLATFNSLNRRQVQDRSIVEQW